MSFITQKGANGPLALTANGQFQTSVDASLETMVGTRWDLNDGREVILVNADSATTIAPGKLYQDAATVANHQNLAVTALQSYSANGNVPATVTVTLGATAAVANQYAGGYAVVNAGTGIGQTLRIANHPAANASASLVLTLEDAPSVALNTADSKVSLLIPHGDDVIVSPTTPSGAAVGIGLYTIPASAYGFLVSKGVVSAIAQGAIPVNAPISPSVTTAGSVTQSTNSATNGTSAIIGYALIAGVTTEARAVFVNL